MLAVAVALAVLITRVRAQAAKAAERAVEPRPAEELPERAKEPRVPAKAAAVKAVEGDPKARAREAEERFLARRALAGADPARAFEVQQEAQRAAEELIAVGEVARAADLYRDADMIDEAVHLYVNVLGAPGSAAPLVAARGFHERAAELYEMAGQKERAAMAWADLARKAKDPDKLLDRVEGLSLVVAKAVLRELTGAKALSKATAPLHYRYGLVLEREGEVDRAIEVFQAMQGAVGNYRDIELRVRRLARGEGVSMKAPGVPRDLLRTSHGAVSLESASDAGVGPGDATRMVREAAGAAVARARRASSLPPALDPKTSSKVAPREAPVTQVLMVEPGRAGHPDRTLARGMEDAGVGLDALYDDAVRAAKDGPSVSSLELMIAGRPCDLGNIEVFYRLGLAALASGDWPRAQQSFAAVEDASPGYRDAGERAQAIAAWCSTLARRMPVSGAPRPIPVDAAAGRYEVRGELGRGAMAVVYRATDPVLGREVALKILAEELGARPEAREVFLREARSAAQLDHPNIVTIHDSGVLDGRLFVAMELLEGRTIDALLAAEGKIAVLESLRIARQVLEALDYAHGQQVVHCDVRPSNMMRSAAGLVKLMDFGLARAITPDPSSPVIAGSPAYLSPEQVLGVGVDWRSDLFGVGATLYEMLSGQLPFEGLDRTKRPRPLRELTPGVPEMIEKMVMQSLDPDPDKRFQSAAEFMVPIKRVLFAVDKATRGGTPAPDEASESEVAARPSETRLAEPSAEPDASSFPPPSPDALPPVAQAPAEAGFIDFGTPVAPPLAPPVAPAVTYDPFEGLEGDEREPASFRPAPPASPASTKKTETGIVAPKLPGEDDGADVEREPGSR